MHPHPDMPIRRRPDGSIDTEFHARRGRRLHHEALRKEPVRWARLLARAFARLVSAGSAGSAAGPARYGPGRRAGRG